MLKIISVNLGGLNYGSMSIFVLYRTRHCNCLFMDFYYYILPLIFLITQ